jgi:putative spermidine/putrescine transport system substrate-binding protein
MNRRRKSILISSAAAISVLVAALYLQTRPLPTLTVATWAGPYGRAQANALFRTFGEAWHIDVHIALYDGGLDELRRMVTGGSYDWDVMDFELPDAIEACRRGLLEPIDPKTLPAGADGVAAFEDFVPNALGRCWVGSVVYAQVIAYSQRRFGEARPQTIGDFFDLARFPGPRALRRAGAKFNLELALLADGVSPRDVYDVLSTPSGVRRALAKLSSIRPSLIWWSNSADAIAMLSDGRAAFVTALNGDIYDAAQHGHGVGVIWDRQLYELDVFGIPRGGPKTKRAMDFVRFATSSQSLARVANWVPYGPARRSALALVGNNPELGIAMSPYLPTTKSHFATAFAVNDAWWQAHGAEVEPLWRSWLASGK